MKAEFDPIEEARMSPLARLQKFDRERGSKIFKDKGGRKKWYRMNKPGLKSIMNVPEDELKKYLKQGWQIIDEAAEFTFKDLIERINVNQYVAEKLPANADQGDYIRDFEKSDAPQFKGKSKEKRKEMAIAAYLAKSRGEAKIPTKADLPSMSPTPNPKLQVKLKQNTAKATKDIEKLKQKTKKDLAQFSEQDEPEEQDIDDLKYEKVEETPAVSTADIDDLKAQIASIQNLAEVTHKALDALQTRVDSMEDKSSEGTGTTDEQKFEIIWDYIHTFNSHLNQGGLGNQIDGATELALTNILQRFKED